MAKQYRLTDPEIAAMIEADAGARYEYSIKRIADGGTLWLLTDADGNDVIRLDLPGHKYLPVWPFEKFATIWSAAVLPDCIPRGVKAKDFLRVDIPDLSAEGIELLVFPTTARGGSPARPEDFARDLHAERSRM